MYSSWNKIISTDCEIAFAITFIRFFALNDECAQAAMERTTRKTEHEWKYISSEPVGGIGIYAMDGDWRRVRSLGKRTRPKRENRRKSRFKWMNTVGQAKNPVGRELSLCVGKKCYTIRIVKWNKEKNTRGKNPIIFYTCICLWAAYHVSTKAHCCEFSLSYHWRVNTEH